MMTSHPNGPANSSLPGSPTPSSARPSQDLSYMHRPPTIMPNYGKKQSVGVKLKTNVPRVLLYDNVTQQTILEFQLHGLQSQQHKTYRELNMHMKSFTLRSKAREKHLKNITKVPHFSDYEQFQQEFGGHNDSHGRKSLPRVNNLRTSTVTSSSPGHRKKSRVSKSKTAKSVPDLSREQSESTAPHGTTGEMEHLPRIDNGTAVSLISSKSREERHGVVHNFEPKRQVGFKMEKGTKGVTRIFHTLPAVEVTEPSEEVAEVKVPTAETDQAIEPEQAVSTAAPAADDADLIGAIHEANLPEHNEAIPLSREPSQGVEHSTVLGTSQGVIPEDNPEDSGPLHDYRFELLQQALVIQDPPNDGFIELSPSFVKKYPDVSFLKKFKRAVARNASISEGKRTGEDAKSVVSGFSSLGDHTQTDGDDEEEENEEEKEMANSALKRLGNF